MVKWLNKYSWLFIFIFLLIFAGMGERIQAKSYQISNYDLKMTLTQAGDYLITEEFTYDFLEGNFSWASRKISSKGFSGLEFISIKGLGTEIEDYNVEKGHNLKIKWEFPSTNQPATFILQYRAIAGLVSQEGKNIIDWNPVGSKWQVPIKDLDIEINLPEPVEGLKISPESDLVSSNNQMIHFHYDRLPPQTYYHLKVSFPEIIAMESRVSKKNELRWLVYGLVAGLILILIDLITGLRHKTPVIKSSLGIDQLMPAEIAHIYFTNSSQQKRGITAQVFTLAKRQKIKLVSHISKGIFNTKKTKVKPEILSDDNLSEVENAIIKGLKENEDLEKFARNYKLFNQINLKLKESLIDKGLISKELIAKRKRIYFSSLILALAGLAVLIFGFISGMMLLTGIAVTLFLVAFGRLLKGAITSVLSGEGQYLHEEISQYLDEKKAVLDKLIKEKQAEKSLQYFFEELEYIVIHRKFTAGILNKYKKVFKEAKDFKIPDWLELDLTDLETTIEALEMVEVINYVLISTIFITTSTGTAVAGAGAAGSGAGGGGGAAG